MHRAMYEARPDARAIVHLHSTYVTALSCLWREGEPLIPPLTPYFVMRVGRDVPVVPYFKPGTTDAVAEIREAATRALRAPGAASGRAKARCGEEAIVLSIDERRAPICSNQLHAVVPHALSRRRSPASFSARLRPSE